MGVTSTYALPFPDDEGFVRLGAADIQALAEAVDALVVDRSAPPLLVLSGDAGDPDSDGRLVWDTDPPVRIRGDWSFPAGDRLIEPPSPGFYLTIVQYRFSAAGGVSGGAKIRAKLSIESKVSGADEDTALTFQTIITPPIEQDDTPVLHLSALVRIDETPSRGIQVLATSPDLLPPGASGDDAARLQIVRLADL